MENQHADPEYIRAQMRRMVVTSKLDAMKKFVQDFYAQAEQQRQMENSKLFAILQAVDSTVMGILATIPGAAVSYAQGNISTANAVIGHVPVYAGEVILKGECPVGQSFLNQASFIQSFTSVPDDLSMELYNYYFNYTRHGLVSFEDVDTVLLSKKIQKVVQSLIHCGEDHAKQNYFFREKEIHGVDVYETAAKPSLKTSSGKIYFTTPIGISGTLNIDKMYMFPEIMLEVVTWFFKELANLNITQESLTSGYKELLREFNNITLLHEQYPNSRYNNEEYSYYSDNFQLEPYNSVFINSNFRIKLKPYKDKLDILAYNNGVNLHLRYINNSEELLLIKKIRDGDLEEDNEFPIDINETVLFGKNPDLIDCLDFEINFIPRAADLVKKIVDWKMERLSTLQSELAAQEEEENKKRLPRDNDI